MTITMAPERTSSSKTPKQSGDIARVQANGRLIEDESRALPWAESGRKAARFPWLEVSAGAIYFDNASRRAARF